MSLQVYKEGYMQALADLEEKLNNAKANEGGVHFGEHFVKDVHWDHEIRDQIEQLKTEFNK